MLEPLTVGTIKIIVFNYHCAIVRITIVEGNIKVFPFNDYIAKTSSLQRRKGF